MLLKIYFFATFAQNHFFTMSIGANIKKLREQSGLLQKQVASELGIGYTNYNKLENGNREPSVSELQKLGRLFNMTVDQIINFDGDMPQDITLEDKSSVEQINLIKQLDEDDRSVIYKIIDTMLTKKKFKDFFQKNVAAL
ncbi:MAG: helix-turn-helix domain-containing protein [Bacteroidales bacterium]|nr:helix-turn-helix domain-containing protein [Bacteroidales bacterium]